MNNLYIKEIKNQWSPKEIYTLLIGNYPEKTNGFILESGMDHKKLGRYSFVGVDPIKKIIWKGKGENPFIQIEKELKKHQIQNDINIPFIGGCVGYISYDYKNYIEKKFKELRCEEEKNLVEFYFYDGIVAIDHEEEKTYLISLGIKKESREVVKDLMEILNKGKKKDGKKKIQKTPIKERWEITKERYNKDIESVKENIKEGNVYQINYTTRYATDYKGESFELYKEVSGSNPAPFSCYLECETLDIISSSPERFIRVKGDKIETRPMKGTRPRGRDEKEDLSLIDELQNSIKDRSELLMIIDLMRNDLSRISQPGSVCVPEIFKIEKYPTVLQMVANVEGRLKDNLSLKEIIDKTFPGGSITGAPKLQAMKLIEELEEGKRNIYTGSIGYFSYNGNIDLNIAIRTIIREGDQVHYHVGGGIVWDSQVEEEYQETLTKGRALRAGIKKTKEKVGG